MLYSPDGRPITSDETKTKDQFSGWDPSYNKALNKSWEGDDAFIAEIYEQYLQASQIEKIGLTTTFPMYVRACIHTLKERLKEFESALKKGESTKQEHEGLVFIASKGLEALKKYLELPPEKRLIGV